MIVEQFLNAILPMTAELLCLVLKLLEPQDREHSLPHDPVILGEPLDGDTNLGRLSSETRYPNSTATDRLSFRNEGGSNDATDGCEWPSDESGSNSYTHRFVRDSNSSKRTKERMKILTEKCLTRNQNCLPFSLKA